MSWLALTSDHVLDRLSSDERVEIEEAGESTPADRLTGIIEQVINLVRGKVASCDENLQKLGPSGEIPEETLWAAATVARDSLVASLPVAESETDSRREEGRKAHSILDQVAQCKIRIEGPDGAIPETADGGGGVYGGSPTMSF